MYCLSFFYLYQFLISREYSIRRLLRRIVECFKMIEQSPYKLFQFLLKQASKETEDESESNGFIDEFVGNKAKARIAIRVLQEKPHQVFWKTNISYPLITPVLRFTLLPYYRQIVAFIPDLFSFRRYLTLCLLDPRSLSEGSYEIGAVRPSFRLSVSFLGIGSLVFFWNLAWC